MIGARMLSTNFHLCAEGEKLYLDWSRLDALTTMPLACMRMMSQYASETHVPVERSKGEIERILRRYGAESFMHGWDRLKAVVGFDINGRRYRIVLPMPDTQSFRLTETGRARVKSSMDAAYEQAIRQRWRAMALWIKAVLEAAEAGIVTLEEVLQPFTVLPNGQTAGQWLAPQIEAAYQSGRMPPLLPAGRGGDE